MGLHHRHVFLQKEKETSEIVTAVKFLSSLNVCLSCFDPCTAAAAVVIKKSSCPLIPLACKNKTWNEDVPLIGI